MKSPIAAVALVWAVFLLATRAVQASGSDESLDRSLRVGCFKHWTRDEEGTSGRYVFQGTTNSNRKQTFDNPVYFSLTTAQEGLTSTNRAKERLSGSLRTSSYTGVLTMDFFKGNDQIKFAFDRSTGKGVIASGKGCYVGITGAVTRKAIGSTVPRVFEWSFCPKVAPECKPE